MKHKLNCILVIDDDEPTNFFTRMILEESEFTKHIRIAESGKEALTYLASSKDDASDKEEYPVPDLILLDINMPAMNGWEFLEEYRKMNFPSNGKTKTVMLTTSLFPEDRFKANALEEVSGFENKPLTIEKLENIVQTYF